MWFRPDGSVKVIEVSVPSDQRAHLMRNDKRLKYGPLIKNLRRTHKGYVDFVPVVIGGTGVITGEVTHAIKRLEVDLEVEWLQKIAATSTCNILRQLL